MIKIKKIKENQTGIALLISLLLTGVLISIVLAMSLIFIPKIRLAGDVKKSSTALYSAESAIEWCLYVHFKGGNPSLPVMNNGATYVNQATNLPPTAADCAGSSFQIIGTYQNISRSFEISGL